jgi:hypothetical protein
MPLLSADMRLTLRQITKVLGKFVLTVVIIWAAFRYICDFTNTQSWVLGFAFVYAVDTAASRRRPEEKTFTPHRLSFVLNMFPILLDLGFVEGGEGYDAIAGPTPEGPMEVWSDEHIFHRHIMAYVLATDPGLVHLPRMFRYTEELDLEIKLNRIKRTGKYNVWSPGVFIRRWYGGYAIGVRVKDEWWDEIKSKIAPGVVLGEDKEWNFGTVRLTMAFLPAPAFHSLYADTRNKYQETVKALVVKHGWKNEDLGGPEVGYFGESYEHKYATVWVQPID